MERCGVCFKRSRYLRDGHHIFDTFRPVCYKCSEKRMNLGKKIWKMLIPDASELEQIRQMETLKAVIPDMFWGGK